MRNAAEDTHRKITVKANGRPFTATLAGNAAGDALAELLAAGPLTIRARDFSGFEKVGPLGRRLPASDRRTTTRAGDIVLYQGDQIVAFYGSNTWAYTRLAVIDDLTGWKQALGTGDATFTLSLP